MRIVDWYALRWRIEDWHRSLKCEVEETGHHTAARLERVAVIAWRIMLMSLLARKTRSRRNPVSRTWKLLVIRGLRDETAANAEAQDAQRSSAYRRHHGRLP